MRKELLRTSRYDLSLWSDDQPVSGRAAVTDISGHIDITGIAEAVVLVGPDILILTVEDGASPGVYAHEHVWWNHVTRLAA
jgi:hypothetical protein